MRGIETIVMAPREVVKLNGRRIETFPVNLRIAAEPTYDDLDRSVAMMVILLALYFLLEPLHKFVFMTSFKCCQKEKKKKLSEK